MKSALFVDFDNVYSGLRKLDPAMAEQFAQKPQRWMQWLVSSLELPEHAPADARRRVLVRRCYLNPQVYQRFRPSFNLAGFEIIDCPALTSEGKTSTDIHMVLDIVDLLQHEAHYDEFIVFSADADFTPVLRKLRRWDRRTTVLAIGFPSAAYRASADLLIDQDSFVRDALGFRDEEGAAVESGPSPTSPAGAAHVVGAAQQLIRRKVAESSAPIALSLLASTILKEVEGMDATSWAGFGSFRKLVEASDFAPCVVCWDGGGVIHDPRRHAPPKATASKVRVEDELDAVIRLIRTEVAASPQPVPCGRIAQLITVRHGAIAEDWNGSGSFRKMIESLDLSPLAIDWSGAGGRIYEPSRHSLASANGAKAVGGGVADWGKDADLLPLATQIHDVINAPLFPPANYQALFRLLAADLVEHPFDLNETGKRLRDKVRAEGRPINRSQVSWILLGLLLRGHQFGGGQDDHVTLARKTADNVRSLCLREQMIVDANVDASISRWIVGGRDT
ncbi:NYN domain-containing protein [Aromatoleum evansii]|uniref:NYN domain-containing protein n=1 Tax=Aromatoleum evansii TaxID=59406 RepID=UPI00145CC71D|nr:NYN domain-containing protein [Aromatoleum evansii]NMG27967.1 NYN domain-containing protein [Aromatoleum evansii]